VASEKYLAVVGMSEEDVAHIRLLLRASVAQLEHRWHLGTEDNADLIIVDPGELGGQIARNRAFSGGRRCAVLSDNEPLRNGEVRLTKPLRGEGFVAVLNGTTTAAEVAESAPVSQFKNDFYDVDSFNPEFEIEDDEAADARAFHRDENPAPGLDELLKPDTEAAKPLYAVPIKLDTDTRIQHTPSSSKRGDRRMGDSVRGIRRPEGKPEGINLGSRLEETATVGDVGMRPLRDYLRQNLLGGPSTTLIEGAPPLTLDPKERKYHSAGGLRALAPYCKMDFTRAAWKTVTTQELTRLRSEEPAQPYVRLVWLDVLIRSGGRLASHLDPGGRYRLKAHPKTEPDFPNHARIVAAMEQQPLKLNEIAATSGVSMAEVFDMISAYEAVGLIEVESRKPRHKEPEQPSGLFARLRKPFGKA
jgi:hypothetical protein